MVCSNPPPGWVQRNNFNLKVLSIKKSLNGQLYTFLLENDMQLFKTEVIEGIYNTLYNNDTFMNIGYRHEDK